MLELMQIQLKWTTQHNYYFSFLTNNYFTFS